MGSGTGMYKGKQRFVCKKDYALFKPATTIIPEEEYDGNIDHVTERLGQSDGFTASLGYGINSRSQKNGMSRAQSNVQSMSIAKFGSAA